MIQFDVRIFFKWVEATDYNGMSQEVSKSLGSVGDFTPIY